jgi:DNA (cytosine-5)-methyltransferase 1
MFKTVDLFSGIGGIAYSLSDIVDVLFYCDNNPIAQNIMMSNMNKRLIPRAPVVNNIFNREEINKYIFPGVDLLISSSPCIGFSSIGNKKGLLHTETNLLYKSFEIIKDYRPKIIFIENVPGIMTVNNGIDFESILTIFKTNGYLFKWTILGASDVGALHVRKRWFCLAIKKNYIRKLPDLPISKREPFIGWLDNDIILDKYDKSTFKN